jgi:lipopolysaccharide export system permease protein
MGYLSLFLSPLGASMVEQILDDASSQQSVSTIVPGRFQNYVGRRQVSYAETLSDKTWKMQNIFIAEVGSSGDSELQPAVVVAESGEIVIGENEQRYLKLENGYRYEGFPGKLDFTVVKFDGYSQLIDPQSKDKERQQLKAEAKPTRLLWQSDQLKDKAALHWRMSLPLLVPIIAVIALALSKTDHRRGRYVKILPAILIYICYLVALSAARSGIETGKLPESLGLWWVHGLFILLAAVLFFSEDLYRQWRYRSRAAA